jgi:diguanylate cyclase (GGDEF)-like protein
MMASGHPPQQIPSLFDFISIQDAELYLPEDQRRSEVKQPERAYDEKFHILQAPALFLSDIQYYRTVCDLRRVPCSVAFIDIDDFKKFNSEVTETEVDRSVLPPFMRTLEAHFFSHGHAYRQGGDEYLAILPAMSRRFAIEFFDELRCLIAALTYSSTNRKTTVSIGLCVAEPDCLLTDRELQQKANRAKEHAKVAGKNCICTFKGEVSYSTEIEKVRPVS